MSTPELMKTAATRMEAAAKKLAEARELPFTPGALKQWMEALTEYALALGEVQQYSQQSIHEKLQAVGRELHRPAAPEAKRRAG